MIRNNLTKELVTRTNRMSFYKYIGVLPNPDKLFVQYGKTYQTYRDLKTDPHLWACIQSRKAGTLARKYELLPGAASSDVCDFVRLNLENIDMQQLIRQILDAVFMGFQAFEIIWQTQYYGGATLYSVKNVAARPQEYFCFDMNGNLQLQLQSSGGPDRRGLPTNKLPSNKILLIQHESDYDNPYGQALLGKCYWACTFKSTALRFWVNFIEKFGLPTIIASSEHVFTDAEQESLLEKLMLMQESNTVVAGGNLRLDLHETNKSGNVELYQHLISLCNAEMSKVILSSTLTTEIEVGSYAAAQTHQAVRQDVVESDLEIIEKGLNSLIAIICSLNFGQTARPVFKFV